MCFPMSQTRRITHTPYVLVRPPAPRSAATLDWRAHQPTSSTLRVQARPLTVPLLQVYLAADTQRGDALPRAVPVADSTPVAVGAVIAQIETPPDEEDNSPPEVRQPARCAPCACVMARTCVGSAQHPRATAKQAIDGSRAHTEKPHTHGSSPLQSRTLQVNGIVQGTRVESDEPIVQAVRVYREPAQPAAPAEPAAPAAPLAPEAAGREPHEARRQPDLEV